MQYKVPQNIDKEDEIVGPLTLVQFSYVAIAGAIDFLIFKALPGFLGILIILPITLIGVAFAFVKIQDRPLLVFIQSFVNYTRKPKIRVWQKISDRPILKEKAPSTPTDSATVAPKAYDKAKIAKLSAMLDARGHSASQTAPQPFSNINVSPAEQPSPNQDLR